MKISKNSFVTKKASNPHPGKVKIHVMTISFTTPKLIADTLLPAPTPIIEVVFTWVVDTGRPNTEQNTSEIAEAISAEKP